MSTLQDRSVSTHTGTTDVRHLDIGAWFSRGMAAGTTAGVGFILANMWYAVAHDKPPVAPFLAISTIFHGSDMPAQDPAAIPADAVAGLVLHLGLSILFGIGFAILLALIPRLRHPLPLVVAALVYGLALYVVNFQILGRTLFPFFTNPAGPNQLLELIVHPLIFGLLLVPFFLGYPERSKG